MTDELADAVELRFDLPSEIRLVDLVHAAIERVAALGGLDEGEGMNLALAVREAVINAIQHGNRGEADRRVLITITLGDGTIEVRVRDEGDGFDPARIEDPTAGPNLLATSGRGLLLIRAFVDEVQFNRPDGGGTEIALVKRRESDDG